VPLPPDVSVELLDVSIAEYEDALYGALNQRSLLSSFKVASDAQG